MKGIHIFKQVAGIGCAVLLAAGGLRAEQVDVSRLTLVGIAEVDGVTYASLYDAQNGEHFLTSSKDAGEGFELVSVTDSTSATIRQNGQTFLLRLDWPAATVAVADAVARPAPVTQDIPQPGSVAATAPTPPKGAKLPLVFQAGDLAKLNLSDDQKAEIARLRQQFSAAVNPAAPVVSGPSGAAQTTPATDMVAPGAANSETAFRDWRAAQEQSDALFVMYFGQEAFNLSQMGLGSKPSP